MIVSFRTSEILRTSLSLPLSSIRLLPCQRRLARASRPFRGALVPLAFCVHVVSRGPSTVVSRPSGAPLPKPSVTSRSSVPCSLALRTCWAPKSSGSQRGAPIVNRERAAMPVAYKPTLTVQYRAKAPRPGPRVPVRASCTRPPGKEPRRRPAKEIRHMNSAAVQSRGRARCHRSDQCVKRSACSNGA